MKLRIVVTVILSILIGGSTLYFFVTNASATIQLSNPAISGKQGYSADVAFTGIADMEVVGSCKTVNTTNPICNLDIGVALNMSPRPTNVGLATKTITVELLNAQSSQFAVVSSSNISRLRVIYGGDNSGDKFAAVNTPFLVGGGTWDYLFLILDPPTVGGNASLSLVISANLVATGLLSHNYDLEASINLPSQ
jgi:hypothetical protein